jgi:hypothetical protein
MVFKETPAVFLFWRAACLESYSAFMTSGPHEGTAGGFASLTRGFAPSRIKLWR